VREWRAVCHAHGFALVCVLKTAYPVRGSFKRACARESRARSKRKGVATYDDDIVSSSVAEVIELEVRVTPEPSDSVSVAVSESVPLADGLTVAEIE
jgi:hypothetical protein